MTSRSAAVISYQIVSADSNAVLRNIPAYVVKVSSCVADWCSLHVDREAENSQDKKAVERGHYRRASVSLLVMWRWIYCR